MADLVYSATVLGAKLSRVTFYGDSNIHTSAQKAVNGSHHDADLKMQEMWENLEPLFLKPKA